MLLDYPLVAQESIALNAIMQTLNVIFFFFPLKGYISLFSVSLYKTLSVQHNFLTTAFLLTVCVRVCVCVLGNLQEKVE